MLDYTIEEAVRREGFALVCGTDEAGRGPLAGPVVAGACILPEGLIIEGLDDSKKLSEKKREKLFDIICKEALYYGIGTASPEEIDEINILNASLLAMRRAINNMGSSPDFVLVDGNQTRGFTLPARAIVGGDGKCQSIAAASVLAKVTRDRLCLDLDLEYPLYNFKKHKGYPTKEHKLAVYRYGPSPCHRKSFLSFLERDREKLEEQLEELKKTENL